MKDKEMEKLIDACYDVMFQREAEMEELGLLNYGDSSYYIQNPDEYEKDMRIVELENEVKRLEHRLSNCIEPKFKIGQEIWETRPFMAWEVTSIKFKKYDGILYQMYHLGHKGTDDYNCCVLPSDSDRFFATEEEAKAKLEELKNG